MSAMEEDKKSNEYWPENSTESYDKNDDNHDHAAVVGVYSATEGAKHVSKVKESSESRSRDREKDRHHHRDERSEERSDRKSKKKKKVRFDHRLSTEVIDIVAHDAKDKDKDRTRSRSKDHDREKDRDRDRHQHKEKDSDVKSSKDGEMSRQRDDKDRDRDRDRERSRRDRGYSDRRDDYGDRDRERERGRYDDRDRNREPSSSNKSVKPDISAESKVEESKTKDDTEKVDIAATSARDCSPRDANKDQSRKRKDRDESVDSPRRDDYHRRHRSPRDSRDRDRSRDRYDRRRYERSHSRPRYSRPRSRSRERPRSRDRSRERYERPRDRSSDRYRDKVALEKKTEVKADQPKKITLKDIMAANPGISLQEAISKLSSYNTAVAMGIPVSELSSLGHLAPVDMGPNAQQLLNAAAINASITGLSGIMGDSSSALSKPHRELYVGNLPPGCTNSQIADFLNNCMKQIGYVNPLGSVVAAWLSSDGHYAFVEFRTVEEANAALNQLNGVSVGAFQLKIGRPKGYTGNSSVGVPGLGLMTPALGLGIFGTTATTSTSSTWAMITNLPLAISGEQVRELVAPFGSLKAFHCLKATSTGTQTAIFEYSESSATDLAVVGLGNIDLLGSKLMVQRIPANAAELLLKPAGAAAVSSSSADDRNSRIEPTRVIRLSNMTTDEDLNDDELYEDLKEEITEECNKHGQVLSVAIPRNGHGLGFVFVEFATVVDAGKGFKAIAGRKFSGNIVVGSYYPEDLYARKVSNRN
jgi:splicing factor U2AF 65 kDa subunit